MGPVRRPFDRGKSSLSPPAATAATPPAAERPPEVPAPAGGVPRLSEAVGSAASRRLDATRNAAIAIVDDEELNVLTVKRHLAKGGYGNFLTCTESTAAVERLRAQPPDVLLLDIMMPTVSGLDILHVMSLDPALSEVPVLVMTASSDREMKRVCLELGAVDFLAKPLDAVDLVPRVRNTLNTKLAADRLKAQADELEKEVRRRTAQLARSREEVVHCLARAAEFRDDVTGRHVMRVGRYVGVIARRLGFKPAQVEVLELAAQLHDIGKIGVPDAVLFKPGKLDEAEYEVIKEHCGRGRQIIRPLSAEDSRVMRSHARMGSQLLRAPNSPLLQVAAKIAQTHHERWDGTGYPLRLKGEDIPIEGRMTAVADVFDALSSKRPYKDPMPREKCFEIIREGRGSHFDPKVVDAFFAGADEIVAVQMDLMDDV